MKFFNPRILFFLSIFSFAPEIQAAKWFVSTNGNDLNSGNSSSPVLTIQKAIDISSSGDTVFVEMGTYSSFLVSSKNLSIIGTGGLSVVSGNNVSRVVTILNSKVTLENFKLTDGYATNSIVAFRGGLIYSEFDSIWVKNCVFENGYASQGGDYYAGGSHPTFINCQFKRNQSTLKVPLNDGSMFLVDNGNSAQFYNCFVDGYNHPHIFSSGYTHRIFNSTFVNIQTDWFVQPWYSSDQFVFKNSLLVEKAGESPRILPDLSNLWNGWLGTIEFSNSRLPSITSNYSHSTGGTLIVNTCDDEPVVFTNSSSGDYSLSLLDYHHNVGDTNGIFYPDIFGTQRPDQQGLVDLGYIESNASWCELSTARLTKGYNQVGCETFEVWMNGDQTLNTTWSTGQLGDTVVSTILNSGYVSFTTTNAYGCNIVDSLYIPIPPALTNTASVTSSFNGYGVSCNGSSNGTASVTASGGVGPYTYAWTGGSTASTASGLSAGSYTVTVTDANGCTSQSTVTVTQPTALTSTASVTSSFNGYGVSCNGSSNGTASVTASGGVGPYTYAWTGGSTASTASGLSAGSYTVTVTDANGCTSQSTVVVSEPSAISYSSIITDASCYHFSDGRIEVNAIGGAGVLSIQWADGGTSAVMDNLSAGIYAFIITDQNGCSIADSIEISQPEPLEIITDTLKVTCVNTNDGQINIMAYGSNGTFTYYLNDAVFSGIADGLSNGLYRVKVEDVLGCDTVFTISMDPLYEPCVSIPNWFSPDGNGENDTWRIRGIEYESLEVRVFTINGIEVYRSKSANYQPWDGTHNGLQLPTGDYYYVIQSNGNFETYSGYVTILR